MTRIEHGKRRIPWLAILVAVALLLLAFGWYSTLTTFKARGDAVSEDYSEMREMCDRINEELEAMR